jgi:hypothetical protein
MQIAVVATARKLAVRCPRLPTTHDVVDEDSGTLTFVVAADVQGTVLLLLRIASGPAPAWRGRSRSAPRSPPLFPLTLTLTLPSTPRVDQPTPLRRPQ